MSSVTPATAESAAGESVWAFEVSSGLLVFFRQELRYPDGTPQSGFVMTLLGQREMPLPWRRGSVPEWVAPGTRIRLTGMQYYYTGIGPAVPLSMEIDTRVCRVGRLWSEQSHTMISSGRVLAESNSVTGVVQPFFGYWLPRTALESLEAGETLDHDALTGVTIRVAQTDRNRVVLEAVGVGHVTRLVYDAGTGALIALYQEQQNATGTLVIDLAAQ
jgi:hypothetical protein